MTATEIKDSLERIEDLINQLPPPVYSRKNIIEIAGYPSWENVNSNFLAFYFDEKEQHNFGRTIFLAFLNLLNQKFSLSDNITEGEYIVERETERIDILIHSDNYDEDEWDWAILIENKINATLYNDLKKYWNSVKAKTKIGILLTVNETEKYILHDLKSKGINYLNICHSELLDEIKNMLPLFYTNSDDRHLLFLKDFIQNVSSFYEKPDMKKEMEEKLKLFHDNFGTIKRLKELENELQEYVTKTVISVMAEFGYKPSSMSYKVQGKYFYFDKENIGKKLHLNQDKFRFYIWLPDLFNENYLTMYFELFDEAVKNGENVKNNISNLEISAYEYVSPSNAGGTKYSYFHIAVIKCDLNKVIGDNLNDKLKNVIGNAFFLGKKPFVQRCAELYEE